MKYYLWQNLYDQIFVVFKLAPWQKQQLLAHAAILNGLQKHYKKQIFKYVKNKKVGFVVEKF